MSKDAIEIKPVTYSDYALARERLREGVKVYERIVSWDSFAQREGALSPFELLDPSVGGFEDGMKAFQATDIGKGVESLVIAREPVRQEMDESYIAFTNTGRVLVLPSWLGTRGGMHADFTQIGILLDQKQKKNTCTGLSEVLKRAVIHGDAAAVWRGVTDASVQSVLDRAISGIRERLEASPLRIPQAPR